MKQKHQKATAYKSPFCSCYFLLSEQVIAQSPIIIPGEHPGFDWDGEE